MTDENLLTLTAPICNPLLLPRPPIFGKVKGSLSIRVEKTNDSPKTLYLFPSTVNGTS